MRIDSITIINYRQYKNLEYTFNRATGVQNDMNIIIAKNGVGKSNFLNAITWCLYEEESHLQDKNKALPIVNMSTIEETQENGIMKVQVSINIDVNGEKQTILREATYLKKSHTQSKVHKSDSHVLIRRMLFDQSSGTNKLDNIYDDNARILIERLFPKGISQYFFFDNEQMNNYFTTNKGGAIEKAINEISKVTLIQSIINRLKSLESEYRVDLSSTDNIADKLRKEAEIKEKSLKSEQNELQETKNQIDDAEFKCDALKDAIKGAENLKLLDMERQSCISQKEDLLIRIKETEEELSSFIVRYTTLLSLYPAFTKTLELITEKDKAKQLPPDINLDVLKKSINNKCCELCGYNLDNDHLQLIQEKLNLFNLSSPVFELLLSIKHKVIDLKSEAESYDNKKLKILNKLEDLHKKRDMIENRYNDVLNQMKTIPNPEEITLKIDQRELLTKQIKKLHETKGYIESRIKQYEKDLLEAEAKFEKAIKNQEKTNNMLLKYNETKKLKEFAITAEKEIIKEMRVEISSKTFENFDKLIWKENTYTNVYIDENYNVDLIHKHGDQAIGSTSAAERALLALSFTNAIHEISGFESPLVIDSPVGRVSDENRRRFAETLANISKNKQVIMLFTPDEYSEDVSAVFDGISIKSHALLNAEEEIATIKEV